MCNTYIYIYIHTYAFTQRYANPLWTHKNTCNDTAAPMWEIACSPNSYLLLFFYRCVCVWSENICFLNLPASTSLLLRLCICSCLSTLVWCTFVHFELIDRSHVCGHVRVHSHSHVTMFVASGRRHSLLLCMCHVVQHQLVCEPILEFLHDGAVVVTYLHDPNYLNQYAPS